MNKDLIIVESPAKVKTIKKFLGDSYQVEASVGHVRDLPTKTLGVDESEDFSPVYEIVPGKEKVVQKLRKAAERAGCVYLAPDPDREGEAIAWHVAELIRDANSCLRRIQFNEITASAVQEALQSPRDLNKSLFDAQQARRVLDRLVGYKISPLLWEKVKRGISAGRVQSVALRLIVERERQRQAFVPEEYWVFRAALQGAEPPAFEAELWKVDGKKPRIGNREEAEKLAAEIEGSRFTVHKVEEKERSRNPKPPFITSTLQQEASNKLNFSAKKTMTLAQSLYEGLDIGDRGTTALITYMRTDSVHVAKDARAAARQWIVSELGQDFYPKKGRVFKSKSSAQEAHEAIRPVDVFITPESVRPYLSRDLFVLYKLIWERFTASQMAPARFWDTTVICEAGRTQWRTKGERLIFPGFLRIYTPDEQMQDVEVPPVSQGEELSLQRLSKEQKFTQPPARFSEASLVRKLEELDIGRPSTYAQIISTLRDRHYVEMEKRQFVPTELGYTVNDLLVSHFGNFMDSGFTARMEENLDRIASGEQEWQQVLREFSRIFYPVLDRASKEMEQVKTGKETGLTCEQCGRPLVIKFGRNGAFLACSGYPQCKYTSDFERHGNGEIHPVDNREELVKVGECPKCSSDLVIKKARNRSRFIACSNYPQCKHSEPLGTGVDCPEQGCSGELVEKGSKRGKIFYGCNRFPQCSYAVWNPPVDEPCPECESPFLVSRSTKSRGEHLACPSKSCRYWKQLDSAPAVRAGRVKKREERN